MVLIVIQSSCRAINQKKVEESSVLLMYISHGVLGLIEEKSTYFYHEPSVAWAINIEAIELSIVPIQGKPYCRAIILKKLEEFSMWNHGLSCLVRRCMVLSKQNDHAFTI
jgi:hypothetical protein